MTRSGLSPGPPLPWCAKGDTVLLDAGTTTVEIARLLADKNITIITNSAIITSEDIHGKGTIEIYSTGGLFRPTTKSLVGPAAEHFLRQIRPDKAFIAANGITLESGATTAHASEASIKNTMIGISKEAYLVVDHSKFGKEYFSVIAPAKAFTGIITDDALHSGIRPESLQTEEGQHHHAIPKEFNKKYLYMEERLCMTKIGTK